MNNIIKRFLDIVISGTALIILLPIMLVISFLIKFDSKGPVFFLQERRTKNGKVFRMLKFRSMVVNAEHTGAGLFNYENDPRVTRVGRFLRDSSLDELPQLLNILLGDMAIVGPRPCVVYELGDFDTLNKRYKKRFIVKAGLTGLAQVKGRNNIAWDEKVEFDNEYVDLFSRLGILIDLKIIIETVIKVFHKENIYEVKSDQVMNDEEAAKIAEQEIIRIAHLPD
ncbi:MAG: sugar transferase [Veillonellaceae bacterium]|nr:sugar transferase [Veillonellaceae bacterium]MDD6562896.1 sugar transferase [Veillonellaceae bacterium]